MTDLATALLAARVARPYYARAIAALHPVPRPGLGTVAVDVAWRLYYDPAWLATLDPAQAGLVIAGHEVEHLLRDHAGRARRIDAQPRAWNVAADMEINDDLDIDALPPGACVPSLIGAPDGQLAEEYYRVLPTTPRGHVCGGGSGAGVPLDDELPDDGTGVPAADVEALRDAVAADVRAWVAAEGRGSVPRGVQIWADTHGRPVPVPWPTRLYTLLRSRTRTVVAGRADWAWSRPARRQRPGAPLRPSLIAYQPRVVLIVDTSGSMAALGPIVLGIVASLVRRVGTLTKVIQAETGLTRVTRRLPSRWEGGGGTDLRPAIDAATAADLIVVVTDGLTPWPTVAPSASCVIVLLSTDRSTASAIPAWASIIAIHDEATI